MIKTTHKPRWQLVFVLGVATILSLSGDRTLYTTLPVNAGGLLLTLGQVGVLLSANRFVRLISNPVTGFLLDRGKRRPIFISGMFLGIVATLIYAYTRQFEILFIGRLIWGFAWSFIKVGGNTIIVDATDRMDRGRLIGVLNLMVSLGVSVNPLLGGFLADTVGFRSTMQICALVTGVGFLLAVFLLPETRPRKINRSPEERPTPEGSPISMIRFHLIQAINQYHPKKIGWQTWLAAFLTFIIAFASNGLIMATIGYFLALELSDGINIGGDIIGVTALTGVILGVQSLLRALISPVAGAFSDRAKTRWSAIKIGLALGVGGMVALGLLQIVPAILIGISLLSFADGILITVLPAIVGDRAEESLRGRSMGLMFIAGDLGAALAPLIVYSLITVYPLRAFYLTSAGLFLVGFFLVLGWLFYSNKQRIAGIS